MGSRKKRLLDMTVAAIQQRWGTQALRRWGQHAATAEIPHIPTGFPALDQALGMGGVPRGRITELLGAPTSGMATLALKLMASAQSRRDIAAYVDLGYTFDPDYAARCGVNPNKLLLVRPRTGGEALEILYSLIASRGVGALVFDSVSQLMAEAHGSRAISTALRRLVGALDRSPCACIFLTPLHFGDAASPDNYPSGFALPHYAAVRLLIEKEQWIHKRRDVRGYRARVTVLKNKLGAAGKSVRIAITFPRRGTYGQRRGGGQRHVISCVLAPDFAAAVERRNAPSLAGQPLVIVGGSAGSGRVLAVSGEATGLGVKPGMSLRQARALCPQAHVVQADPARYQRAFETLLEVLGSFTPFVEPGGLQPSAIAYLDLGRLAQAEALDLAQRIGQAVQGAVGLIPCIGLANGKFPAYIAAASAESNQALLVAPGRETDFLAPFPVDVLPLDEEVAHRLQLLGIRTLGQLAALPAEAVSAQFGVAGRKLHRLARGYDGRPIQPYRPEATESASRTLDGPVAERTVLEAVARSVAAELAKRLQAKGLAARQVRLVLYLEDGAAHAEQLALRQPTGDVERLACILNGLVIHAQLRQGVIGLEVTLADLIPNTGQQLDLFVHQGEQESRLRQALRDLVARYGAACFYRVALLNREARLPERRFRLQEMEAP